MSTATRTDRPARPSRPWSRDRVETLVFGVLRWVVIAALILLTVFPFLYMVLLSVRDLSSVIQNPGDLWPDSGELDFSTYASVLKPVSEGGQGFVVLHSTTADGQISKISPTLAAGDVVTTIKNTVDKVVTEWGVAELRGRSIRERATALIAVAHPDHRDHLRHGARQLGYV